jgi:hypothetical protein
MTARDYAGSPWEQLVFEIVKDTPAMPDAACRDKSEVFDSQDSTYEASRICARCVDRSTCREWARGRRDLIGTVAGRYRGQSDEAEHEGAQANG